ncbi:unnamed protein product, partial [Onchocerca flexuosa]
MCRDLSGRRLADIKEEEKLRKWIEKAGEREEEKRRQKQEKYEKLKAGPQKHDFNDPDFIQTREKIMEETDEAFEEGITVAKNKRNKEEGVPKSKRESHMVENDDSSGEAVPKRRKLTVNKTLEYMMPKLDDESKSAVAVNDVSKENTGSEKEKLPPKTTALFIAEKSNTIVEKVSTEVVNFDINLDDYDSVEKLESLGLDR